MAGFQLGLTGEYLCEVTVAPTFFAMVETANMTVIGKHSCCTGSQTLKHVLLLLYSVFSLLKELILVLTSLLKRIRIVKEERNELRSVTPSIRYMSKSCV